MSYAFNGSVINDKWSTKDNQPKLFEDDGNDPRGNGYEAGNFSKTGKWTHSPWNWFPDDSSHGGYFGDIKYLYLSEIGGESGDRWYVYEY